MSGQAEKFLTVLIQRYRQHPALLGYDVWNENAYPGGSPGRMLCYCDATQGKFREWLKAKYGTLENLGRSWNRYSFAAWNQVHPPRDFSGYAESLDWLEFRIDDAFRLLRWRVQLFRRLDPGHKVTAHGIAGTLDSLPSSACDVAFSELVDVWGFTWWLRAKGASRGSNSTRRPARAGARGKPFGTPKHRPVL